MKENLGNFVCESGSFMVSDPCYQVGTGCQGKLENVQTGDWCASAEYSKIEPSCVKKLIAVHKSHENKPPYETENAPFNVGVDSGQAGVFDLTHYREGDKESWYSACCDVTLSKPLQAGVIPFGVVSSSGYGDGVYHCKVGRDENDMIVQVEIEFIWDEEL